MLTPDGRTLDGRAEPQALGVAMYQLLGLAYSLALGSSSAFAGRKILLGFAI